MTIIVTATCTQCGRTFTAKRTRPAQRSFCSLACRRAWSALQPVSCEICGVTFLVRPARAKVARFCSNACRHLGHRLPLVERLWSKVVVAPYDDGCWVFVGDRHEHGYGRLGTPPGEAPIYAHRLSWELANGPIPPGLDVLHRCDNPPCVRPDHLFLGTQRDNNHDRDRKGRVRHGSAHPTAKLTDDQVRYLRTLVIDGRLPRGVATAMAREYGTRLGTIQDAALGYTWQRLDRAEVSDHRDVPPQ